MTDINSKENKEIFWSLNKKLISCYIYHNKIFLRIVHINTKNNTKNTTIVSITKNIKRGFIFHKLKLIKSNALL